MFERLRKRWSSLTHPIIVKLGDTDPNILTWSSLVVSCVSFWMIANASMDSSGALLIFGSILMIGLAGVMDALDGDLARHQGCLLYTSPSPRDPVSSRMPSSA